jgi:hypothetical protein
VVDTRIGTAGVPRFAVVALMALSLLMAAALAAPTRADAHQTAGTSTQIFIDGKSVLLTPDDHFVYTRVLSRGCHDVRVVQRRHSATPVAQEQSSCSKKATTLTITVNDRSVSISS